MTRLTAALSKAEMEKDAAKAIIIAKRSPEWADQAIAFDLAAKRADDAEAKRDEALGTADGYREACDRAEAERDAWHHKCDVAVASVAHIETERDRLLEQRGTLQEYSNAGYAENEALRAQLAEAREECEGTA